MHDMMDPDRGIGEHETIFMVDEKELARRRRRSPESKDEILTWGDAPKDARQRIRHLRMDPRNKDIVEIHPCVHQFENLKYLEIPYRFVKNLTTESIPETVEILRVTGTGAATWPKKARAQGLDFVLATDCQLKLPVEAVPNVTRLLLRLDSHAKMLDRIVEFTSLVGLHLYTVNSNEIFSRISRLSLKFLGLSSGKLDTLEGLSQLGGLTNFYLNSFPNLERLSGLRDLTDLSELTVAFCNRLVDVQDIYELNALRKLRLHDCSALDTDRVEKDLKAMKLEYVFVC
jgi:Leucine-rich repeat (LRR) protein